MKEANLILTRERKSSCRGPRRLKPRPHGEVQVQVSSGEEALDHPLIQSTNESVYISNPVDESNASRSEFDSMQVPTFESEIEPQAELNSSITAFTTVDPELTSVAPPSAGSFGPNWNMIPDVIFYQGNYPEASEASEVGNINFQELQSISQLRDLEPTSSNLRYDFSTWSLDYVSSQLCINDPVNSLQISDGEEDRLDSTSSSLRDHDPSSQFSAKPQETTPFHGHTDPILTILNFSQSSMFRASLLNARALGITAAQLMTAQHLSPFYRQTTPSDDITALLASSYNPSFPPNLQPTLPQILYPHHAYLDLVPFPVLRARAITLGAIRPRLFHYSDLKKDIVVNGGLKFVTGNMGANASGHSWDIRSWQVEPWFLRKWRMLLVREDTEVWM
jgi:hypothetical protein